MSNGRGNNPLFYSMGKALREQDKLDAIATDLHLRVTPRTRIDPTLPEGQDRTRYYTIDLYDGNNRLRSLPQEFTTFDAADAYAKKALRIYAPTGGVLYNPAQ